MTVTFSACVSAEAAPLKHTCEHTIGSGHARLALRADWQEQFRRSHDELGFRYRSHDEPRRRVDHGTVRAFGAGVDRLLSSRTTFWAAVADYETHAMTRAEASTRVAQRCREWASILERTP